MQVRGWFGELIRRRQSGFSVNPISYTEIKAWADLTGRSPTPLEVLALTSLDDIFISSIQRKDDDNG